MNAYDEKSRDALESLVTLGGKITESHIQLAYDFGLVDGEIKTRLEHIEKLLRQETEAAR